MWKSVFIEVIFLSVMIFGGFYINANILARKISAAQESILNEQSPALARLHLSGYWFLPDKNRVWGNLSGNKTSSKRRSSVSGFPQISEPNNISGNKA